jgi:hypothetical protein
MDFPPYPNDVLAVYDADRESLLEKENVQLRETTVKAIGLILQGAATEARLLLESSIKVIPWSVLMSRYVRSRRRDQL